MRPTDRYAMRDARIRASRENEARILLHDEIQGYKDRIAELEKELAELKKPKEPEAATKTADEPEADTTPEAEKSPATASAPEPTPSPSKEPEAATKTAKAKSKGKK